MLSKLKACVQQFLSERPHKAGETVQFGWFWFRIVEAGSPPEIETLDMKGMASFTTDFHEAERVHQEQCRMVTANGVEADDSITLMHSALVSKNYRPGVSDAFLKHDEPSGGIDSGWYVGIYDDPLDMDDPDSFHRQSLYELTIHDMRMARYWTLPQAFLVHLDTSVVDDLRE
ncbi:MAG: hypothetical protein V4662_26070 [Verrucomicrobiota bacterium]